MIPALLGLPPTGLGVYVREAIETHPRWDFAAVNASRVDAAEQARELRARGVSQIWVYATPEHFRPDTWRDGLARGASVAASIGAVGIIADPEGNWLATREHRAQAIALGQALGSLARTGVRVGLTSYPEWRYVETVAEAAGGALWGSPQVYGRTSQSPAVFARWVNRWRAVFGERLAVSIAGWASSDALASDAGFRAYLAALPDSPGRIVWDAAGNMPTRISDALESARPSVINRALLLGTGAGVVALLVCVGIAVAVYRFT